MANKFLLLFSLCLLNFSAFAAVELTLCPTEVEKNNKWEKELETECNNPKAERRTSKCFTLAWQMHRSGRRADGLKWFKKSCELKDYIACLAIAVVTQDDKALSKANEQLENECKKGDQNSCKASGWVDIEFGNVAVCEGNDPEACSMIGSEEYYNGNFVVAWHLLQKACVTGQKKICEEKSDKPQANCNTPVACRDINRMIHRDVLCDKKTMQPLKNKPPSWPPN